MDEKLILTRSYEFAYLLDWYFLPYHWGELASSRAEYHFPLGLDLGLVGPVYIYI